MSAPPKRFRRIKRLVLALAGLLLAGTALALIVLACMYREALYHRFILFPRQAEAWQAIRNQREPVTLDDHWNEFRGVCHSHSEISHDSEITFPEIAEALRKAGLHFIFMSDHCVDGKADYGKQWRGVHDGIVFVPGYEMSGGFMPWGLPSDTVLDASKDPAMLAREIHEKGGLLFFAHPEGERRWDLPELNGMEIYNLHADFADERLGGLFPDIVLSLSAYPDQMLRLIFDRQTDLLKHWDELNTTRKIVGIAANDCHQNTGFRGFYTPQDTLLVTSTGDRDAIKEWKLNGLKRGLLRLFFGPLEPGKQLFRIELDPYERSARYVNTHLLAKACTEEDLLDAMAQGRVFVAFDMIAPATGFTYLAEGGGVLAVMGETIPLSPGLVLKAASPSPCRFAIVHDGVQVHGCEGRQFEWAVPEPGKYRVEAALDILGEWVPWVYTNPIDVRPSLE